MDFRCSTSTRFTQSDTHGTETSKTISAAERGGVPNVLLIKWTPYMLAPLVMTLNDTFIGVGPAFMVT
jgi:hypothetical protein